MNKTHKRLIAIALAVLLCLTATGCGSGALVYMDYGTGIDGFGRYNTELYGVNGINDPSGADPGVFYVSKEEDPEYGGYFYRYQSGSGSGVPNTGYYADYFITGVHFYCDRSTDLYHWELAGAMPGGYSLAVDQYDWCGSDFWAPEVIRNPSDGKYYMYFNATSKSGMGISYVSGGRYLGVAVSDTPVGPFDVLGNVDEESGIMCPSINFQVGLNLNKNITCIDAHPFFDDDGQLYLYFARTGKGEGSTGNRIAGVRMKTMIEPDYSTAVILTEPDCYTVTCEPGNLMDWEGGEPYFTQNSVVNEGPYMYKHNGKYYLTLSVYGYTSPAYSVHQAVSDSPLGPFTMLSQEQGNPVLDGSLFGEAVGTGHHSLVDVGDELWIVYHRHASVVDGVGWERPTAVDRVAWVTNSEGIEVMTSNGPSKILTWLPEEISGYKNVARSAVISANNGDGVEYLTDEALNLYTVVSDHALCVESGDVTVTLKWDEPVSVSSVMIYNAASADTAFSQISDLRFKLAQQPEWASSDYDWAVIQDLQLPVNAWDEISETYCECAPAVAEFDAIMVTEIQLTIKEADRLTVYDSTGQINTMLSIPEIVVLGGDVTNE